MKSELFDRQGTLVRVYMLGEKVYLKDIAGNNPLLCSNSFPISLIEFYSSSGYLRRVPKEELPLYVNKKYKSREFLEMFK